MPQFPRASRCNCSGVCGVRTSSDSLRRVTASWRGCTRKAATAKYSLQDQAIAVPRSTAPDGRGCVHRRLRPPIISCPEHRTGAAAFCSSRQTATRGFNVEPGKTRVRSLFRKSTRPPIVITAVAATTARVNSLFVRRLQRAGTCWSRRSALLKSAIPPVNQTPCSHTEHSYKELRRENL